MLMLLLLNSLIDLNLFLGLLDLALDIEVPERQLDEELLLSVLRCIMVDHLLVGAHGVLPVDLAVAQLGWLYRRRGDALLLLLLLQLLLLFHHDGALDAHLVLLVSLGVVAQRAALRLLFPV